MEAHARNNFGGYLHYEFDIDESDDDPMTSRLDADYGRGTEVLQALPADDD